MSLPLLVAIVVIGISVGVLAVHFTGGSKIATLVDGEHAARLLLADFPKEKPGKAHLTEDRQSAFMTLPNGRVGIVQAFGDGFFTRIITAGDIASLRLRDPATLSVRFRDFTWTGGHFHFGERPVVESFASILSTPNTDMKPEA